MGHAPLIGVPSVEVHAKSKRGNTTINHPRLNRDDLCIARMRVFWNAIRLSWELENVDPDSAAAKMTRKKLREMLDGSEGFPSTVKFALRAGVIRKTAP